MTVFAFWKGHHCTVICCQAWSYMSLWSVLVDLSLEILKRFCTKDGFFHLDFHLKHLSVCIVWYQ